MSYDRVITFRPDTSSNWATNNPVLSQGEGAIETDTGVTKIGDGTTAYNDLKGYNMFAQPAGLIQMYGGSSAPSGWLICDGSAISRTTYADLYGIIGTTYGAGDGSTTFNIPDFRGIFPRGAGTNGTLSNANGVAFSGTLGTYQNDKMQGHYHTTDRGLRLANGTGNSLGGHAPRSDGNVLDATMTGGVQSPITDGANGTPRTGTETNPANLAVNFIIKY